MNHTIYVCHGSTEVRRTPNNYSWHFHFVWKITVKLKAQ